MSNACYRWETTTIRGFIQQLAVQYLPHGYWFYVTGQVPASKDPARVDAKLIAKYGIAVSKWTRLRRKRSGEAALHYLRSGRVFVILATHGTHKFFEEESVRIRDVRRTPLNVFGYAISYRRGRACVRIEREQFRRIEAEVLELARFASCERLADVFASLPFEPYAPVHRQLRGLLRKVNAQRRRAGTAMIPAEVVPWKRSIVFPFGRPSACHAPEPGVVSGTTLCGDAALTLAFNGCCTTPHDQAPSVSDGNSTCRARGG